MHYATRTMALALTGLALTGCAGSRVVVPARSACSSLVSQDWRKGVEQAPAPVDAGNDLDRLKAWIAFGVDQSTRLDAANGRTKDAIELIERCERRDFEAIQAARPRFLGVF